jgi:hypothetical protein
MKHSLRQKPKTPWWVLWNDAAPSTTQQKKSANLIAQASQSMRQTRNAATVINPCDGQEMW